MPDPAAIVADVGDAIAAFIRLVDFGERVEVQRLWGDRNDELEDSQLRTIFIDVTPRIVSGETDASGVIRWDLEYDIYTRRTLSEQEQDTGDGSLLVDEIDRMVKLTQDLFLEFLPKDGVSTGILTTGDGNEARLNPDKTRLVTICDRKQLKTLRTYVGWIRLNYIVS